MWSIKLNKIKCLSWGPWVWIEWFHKWNLIWERILTVSNTQQPGGSVVAGGLGDYGSDESEDEDGRSVRGSESSDTDEEELRHRIREKQDAFRRKEREMQLLQEKQAQEALLARGKY